MSLETPRCISFLVLIGSCFTGTAGLDFFFRGVLREIGDAVSGVDCLGPGLPASALEHLKGFGWLLFHDGELNLQNVMEFLTPSTFPTCG